MIVDPLRQLLARAPMPAFLVRLRASGLVPEFANAAFRALVDRSGAVGDDLIAWSRGVCVRSLQELVQTDRSGPLQLRLPGGAELEVTVFPVAGATTGALFLGCVPAAQESMFAGARDAEDGMAALLSVENEMSCRFLADTTLTEVNDAYVRAHHATREELIGRPFADLLPEEERAGVYAHIRDLRRGHIAISTHRTFLPDGQLRWQRWFDQPYRMSNGVPVEFQSVGYDITETIEAVRRAGESERRFRAVLENIAEGVVLADQFGTILHANHRMADVLGWDPADLIGQNVSVFVPKSDRTSHDDYMSRYRHTRKSHIIGIGREMEAAHRDGHLVPIHLSVTEMMLDDGPHFIGVLRDNSAIEAAHRRIERLAFTDDTTGLPNQRSFKQDLEHRLAGPHDGLALLLIDIVDLGALNGAFGFAAGDRALNATARCLESALPDGATLACFGGNLFTVLADLESGVPPEALARTLCDAIEQASLADLDDRAGGGAFRLPPVSVGAALAVDNPTAQQLLEAAQLALVEAKRRSPGSVRVFQPAMRNSTTRRLKMAQGLRRALADREFHIVVQPRFTIDGEKVTGGEALLRWRGPDGVMIPPSDFIPVAEETGLIQQLTDFVVEEVLALLPRLPKGMRVFVNLSPMHLTHRALAATLAARIERHGAAGSQLGVEVTESALTGDMDLLKRNLFDLRALGCLVAIDDFGTGYSSLSRLQHLPIDEVKIDRSFVVAAARGASGVRLMEAIAGMARALRLRVVAEGVETEAELDVARSVGCHEIQGYLWGRPMATEEFVRLSSQGGAAVPA